jgi:hypothetical protein
MDTAATDIKHLLVTETCPPAWKHFDLYLIRDGGTVFYVGQSHSAFHRVWRHILNGYKVRSDVGRFILCNWPASMHFVVEWHRSRSESFAEVGHDLNRAEEQLIRRHHPCFNASWNDAPQPLPGAYKPIGELQRYAHSLRKMQQQARMAILAEDKVKWAEA